jgi:hypothetical protein
MPQTGLPCFFGTRSHGLSGGWVIARQSVIPSLLRYTGDIHQCLEEQVNEVNG